MSSNVENKVPELSPEDKQYLTEQASKVRELRRVETESIARIGSILIEVKAKVHHSHYLDWLKANFQWTDQTARNYVHVAKLVEKNQTVLDLPIDLGALYRLAAPGTDQEVRDGLLTRAASGERITKDIVADAIHPPARKHEAKAKDAATEPATAKPDTKAALIAAILAYEAEHGRVATLTVVRNGSGIDLEITASVAPTTETTVTPGWVPVPPMPAAAPAMA
jgi:lipoprotein-anchoring transpeptidase ErfK/SrfK